MPSCAQLHMKEREWAAIDVLKHVRDIAAYDASAISTVLERGEKPPDIQDVIVPAPAEATREGLLEDVKRSAEQLDAVVLRADPMAHLDITWSHPEFGAMHWREWLLF